MTWECQGRQYHGWFGNGTCGNGDDGGTSVAVQVGYGALPYLETGERRPYEAWLHRGGIQALTTVLPAWERGAGLGEKTFRTRFFGSHGQESVAAAAQDVGTLLSQAPDGPEGDALRLDAGRGFAELVQAAQVEAVGPLMATAVRQAEAAPPRPAPARPAAPPAPRNGTPQQRQARLLREQNVRNMATVMWQEARGQGTLAMTAVGFTLRNRLARSGEVGIADVWRGYNHGAVPGGLQPDDAAAWAIAQRTARDIIDSKLTDPTQGATHFYTPNKMPVENGTIKPTDDIGGGLEDVPGSVSDDGQHHKTYRPRFSVEYPQITVPGIPEPLFKFYRATENVRFGRRRGAVTR